MQLALLTNKRGERARNIGEIPISREPSVSLKSTVRELYAEPKFSQGVGLGSVLGRHLPWPQQHVRSNGS